MKYSLTIFFGLLTVVLPAQTFISDVGLLIPDDGSTVWYDMQVSGLPDQIDLVFGVETVCINLTHTWDSDLEVALIAPDGTVIDLTSGNGGDSDNFENTCFDGNAESGIFQGWGPYTGTFRPEGSFPLVNNGQNPNGVWQLRVHDTYAFADTGIFSSWSLSFGSNPALPFEYDGSDLPIMIITTGGQSIGIDYKVIANMKLINHGYNQPHNVADAPTDYNGFISIEQRGNSSGWMPKRSFNFETQAADGSNNDVSLMDMPAEQDWVLQANYSDKTLMRNYLAQTLFRKTGRYGPRTEFCDVLIDGEYQGVYVLSERIKRDSQRVDIARLDPDEVTGTDITGGYIIKVDWWNGSNLGGWNSQFSPYNEPTDKLVYQYHYPKANQIVQAQKNYIAAYVDSFEVAMKSVNFQDTLIGWRKYAGENSFIDLMLLQELSNGVDSYWLSTFLTKDKNEKLKPGPPWDFDLSFNNADYSQGASTNIWRYEWLANNTNLLPFYFKRIWDDTLFQHRAACRWWDLRADVWSTDSLMSLIDATKGILNNAQVDNFEKWDIMGAYVWPNPSPIPQSYDEEIVSIKTWLTNRAAWMDSQLIPSQLCQPIVSETTALANHFSVSPNPSSGEIWVDWPQDWPNKMKLEIVYPTGKTVGIYDVSRNQVASLDLPSGLYWVKLTVNNQVSIQPLVITK